jgi:hypothetical protein
LAGGNVRLAGKTQADVTIYAQKISVSGDIAGNARLVGENIEIVPGARIGGKLSYASPNVIVADPAAIISGGVVRETMPHVRQPNRLWRVGGWLLGIASGIGVFAIGVLLILLFPRLSLTVEQVVAGSPWRSLALGFAIAMALPVAAMVLLISIIGIPLALAVFALYPPLLLLGYLTTILFVADRGVKLARREAEAGLGHRVLALALALVAFAFIAALPWVGPLVTLLALLIGVGALVHRQFLFKYLFLKEFL